MNCIDFRREKLADPRRLSTTAQAHANECAACSAYARGIDEGELRLEKALRIPVPDGLAERVLLAARTGQRVRLRRLALAAMLVLTSGIGLMWWKAPPRDANARMAIEHVMHEPESFTTTRNADPAFLQQVVHEFGGELNAPLGRIRYIKLCPVPEGTGWHIVFETEQGLATLLLIPNQHLGRDPERATIGGWNALALPGGKGFYAIVTGSPQATQDVAGMLRQRVRWAT